MDRRLPLLYFAVAHLALAAAWATIAADPRGVAGFYYHPRLLAVVHLVTLGWITGSILGALYLIAPMALGARLAGRGWDLAGFGLWAVGVVGMVGHFWIGAAAGMPWTAATLAAGVAPAGARFLAALAPTRVAPAVKLHFAFAFANFFAAAILGALLVAHKQRPFLPGSTLDWVAAHAHLAALGWAAMMVMAAAYRLLPMLLPAAMPAGRRLYWSAGLLEAGVVALGVAFVARRGHLAAALLVVAGFAAFAVQLGWMVRHPRPPAAGRPRHDFGVALVGLALAHLGVAAIAGLVLAAAPPAAWKLSLVLAYGTCGLIGFLAQMAAGVGLRILPLYAWLRGAPQRPAGAPPPSPYRLVPRPAQAVVAAGWGVGVPLLAGGLAAGAVPAIAAGGWTLFAATATAAAGYLAALGRGAGAAPALPDRGEHGPSG